MLVGRWALGILMIAFEAAMGVLVLSGGRWTQVGLIGLIAFHVGLLAFGGVMWVWAPLLLVTLGLLLRAERHALAGTGLPPGAQKPERRRV